MTNKRFKLSLALGKTLSYCWKMLDYWYIFLIYAGILTFISLIFRRWGYSCLGRELPAWCYKYPTSQTEVVLYLTGYYICVSTIIFSFAYDLFSTAYKNTVFKLRNIFIFDRNRIKYIIFSYICLIAFLLPIMLAIYIINRPALPVFELELALFIVVFMCAMFCILFIRLYSFIGYYMSEGKMPSLKDLFHVTGGRAYVAIVLFITVLLISCIGQVRLIGSLTRLNEQDTFLMTVVSEYIDFFVRLFFLGMFLASCRAQYDLIKEEPVETEAHAKSAEIEGMEPQNDNKVKDDSKTSAKPKKKSVSKKSTAKKSVTKKSSSVKKSSKKKN